MALSNENNPQVLSIHLGSLTTDATVVPATHFAKRTKIKSVKLMNGAIVAASDANFCQVALRRGTTVVAELDTRAAHENGLAANAAKALNLVDAESEPAAGTDLNVLYNETGTVALTDAKLIIEHYSF